MAWIKWDDLCRPLKQGGLGLKELSSFNKALLCEWVWRFLTEENNLWKRVIISRHGGLEKERSGLGLVGSRSNTTGWWRKILGTVAGEGGKWFWDKVSRKLGDGKETNFWDDVWVGESSLKNRFPRLYYLNDNRTAKVCDMGSWRSHGWNWEIRWRRSLREREEEAAVELDELLQHVTLTQGRSDRWVWCGSKQKGFTVKQAYEEIIKARDDNHQNIIGNAPYRKIWKMAAPYKTKAMAWRLIKNKLPTMDNIRKRLNISEAEGKCCCCSNEEESSRHFFLECPEVQKIWQKMIRWCGIDWATPRNILDHFISFSEALDGDNTNLKMGGLWICVVWVLWKWRNSVKHDQIEWNFRRIEEEIKCRFWSWGTMRGEGISFRSFDYWNNCRLCEVWLRNASV